MVSFCLISYLDILILLCYNQLFLAIALVFPHFIRKNVGRSQIESHIPTRRLPVKRLIALLCLLTACGSAPQEVAPTPAPNYQMTPEEEARTLRLIAMLPKVRADLARYDWEQKCMHQMFMSGFDPTKKMEPDCEQWVNQIVAEEKAKKAASPSTP